MVESAGRFSVQEEIKQIIQDLRGPNVFLTEKKHCCNHCGYRGQFNSARCYCHMRFPDGDVECSAEKPQAGCSRGQPVCPICDGGGSSLDDDVVAAIATSVMRLEGILDLLGTARIVCANDHIEAVVLGSADRAEAVKDRLQKEAYCTLQKQYGDCVGSYDSYSAQVIWHMCEGIPILVE